MDARNVNACKRKKTGGGGQDVGEQERIICRHWAQTFSITFSVSLGSYLSLHTSTARRVTYSYTYPQIRGQRDRLCATAYALQCRKRTLRLEIYL